MSKFLQEENLKSFCDLEGLKLLTIIYSANLKKIHSLVQEIFYLQDYHLQNGVKVTKIVSALKLVTVIY